MLFSLTALAAVRCMVWTKLELVYGPCLLTQPSPLNAYSEIYKTFYNQLCLFPYSSCPIDYS